MRVLTAVWTVVLGIFAGLKDFLGTVLGGFFGALSWQPPAWLQTLLDALLPRLRAALDWRRAHPRESGLALAVLLLLLAAGLGGWRWWQSRPQPQTLTVSVEAPALTCYACEAPDDAPKPLVLRFSGSAAALELVGKEIAPASGLIRMSPAQPGQWRWSDDKTLQFTPSQDWPVGAHYQVDLNRKGLIAAHLALKDYRFEFDSQPFSVSIAEASFDQDPVNPANKTVILGLRFSHPVNPDSLKDRIRLSYFDRLTDEKEVERERPLTTLKLDAKRLNAYLRTAALATPAKSGRLHFVVAPGIASSLPGPAAQAELVADVSLPGRYALQVGELATRIARDVDDNPVQLLSLSLSHSSTEAEVQGHVQAWLLPLRHPDALKQKEWEKSFETFNGQPYPWGQDNIGTTPPAGSEPLKLDHNPLETEHAQEHSFGHAAEPGRWLLVRVAAGMKSFGGYELEKSSQLALQVPDYPPELRVMGKGALLAMGGPKKLSVFSRDLPGLRVEVGRLLPRQLQHLVTQSGGELATPYWNNWQFDESNISERLEKVLTLPALPHGTPQYTALDLAPFLAEGQESKRGIFFLRVHGHDPVSHNDISVAGDEGGEEGYEARVADTRLIVVTDLGLVLKRNKDGSREVFVQSILSGQPLAGVSVEVIGKNGEPVLSRDTDEQGHARLPDLGDYQRERQPVLLLARKGGDQSFLPLDGRVSSLDLSRFDVGGVSQATEPGALSAFLFSDRGLYRPGERAELGVIVRAADFDHPLPRTPLRYTITDPRGAVVLDQRRPLPEDGFDSLAYTSRPNSATGEYSLSVYLPQPRGQRLLGSFGFKVREFEPDRLKMRLDFEPARAQGWVSPEALAARVDLQNLFGTPAQSRRVSAEMNLTPWLPAFAGYEDYRFNDPQAAREGYTEALADTQTDEQGQATLALDLKRFARASYRVHLTARGFEPDGGRGVTAEAAQIVSDLPYLIGWKADGDLDYVSQSVPRSVRLQALDPQAQRTAVKDLQLKRYQRKYVNVLIRRPNGSYQYESRQKDLLLSAQAYTLRAGGAELKLEASEPGSYFYLLVDAEGQSYANIPYRVAGAGDVSRSLEKNAELQMVLSKKDYAPGEEIELSLVAPYVGSGLITIEREKVLSWQWFKTETTASVQRIRVPADLIGSAYVHVIFLRDPGSAEIHASPMSHGVQPFSVSIDARRNGLSLKAPAKLKPGETLRLQLSAQRPGRAVVYAVDEGILQVARYQTPQPLEYFFQKRSLDVDTLQILDLVLPSFRALMPGAAPGGDADGALGRHLNPFRRKTDPPVAWWSGIVAVGPEPRTLEWTLPESYNGSLRLMAVGVDAQGMGQAEARATVRGDFTLLPNAPLAVAPGDEFEVSTGVAFNAEEAKGETAVQLQLQPSANLEVLGATQQSLAMKPLSEAVVRYRLRAKDEPGPAELRFSVKGGAYSAKLGATLSVRPATPYRVQLDAASVPAGKSVELPLTRSLYPQHRELAVSVSPLPLALAHGLATWLGNYAHACTEQLVSMAMPALVLSARPEFGALKTAKGADLDGSYAELASRQTPDGGYRLWPNGAEAEFVSVYVQHFLLEAAERGRPAPGELIEAGNRYLLRLARRDGDNLEQERNAAYAIYLLTRQGQVMSAEADALRGRLEANWKNRWESDATAAWLAAAYQRMQQQALADKLIARVKLGRQAGHYYDRYHSPMATDAELFYVLAKHFPKRLAAYGPEFVANLVAELRDNRYQSLSAATSILALEAYAQAAEASATMPSLKALLKTGGEQALSLPPGLFPQLPVSEATKALRVSSPGPLPAYALLSQAGFDRQPPPPASQGMEILRSYTDLAGKPVSQVRLGEEIEVHLKFRSTERDWLGDVALVDLLPGGFEIVQPSGAPAEQVMQQVLPDAASEGESEGAGSEDAGNLGCGCNWLSWLSGARPTYADYREDRAVLYVDFGKDVSELKYRIKATTAGRFQIPPAYGEAMYEPSIYARAAAGQIEVLRP